MVDRAISIAKNLIENKGYTENKAKIETVLNMSNHGATAFQIDEFIKYFEKPKSN